MAIHCVATVWLYTVTHLAVAIYLLVYERGRLSEREFLTLCSQGTYENNLGLATSAI